MNLLDLDIPILQAPIAGADTVELAAAVSNAGGMGGLGMAWTQPEGADFVICQGIEAGGHVQSTTPLATLLPQVMEVSRAIPVVAAGGLATGSDICWAIGNGATAVMLGTRFVATTESQAHPLYKEAIIKANDAYTSFSLCFDGEWPYAAHRVLRNNTLKQWESAGCPPSGSRPGEGDVVALTSSGEKIRRYSSKTPAESITGDVNEWCLYAGTSVEGITDIPNARELVHRLWDDCQNSYDKE